MKVYLTLTYNDYMPFDFKAEAIFGHTRCVDTIRLWNN